MENILETKVKSMTIQVCIDLLTDYIKSNMEANNGKYKGKPEYIIILDQHYKYQNES